MTNYQSNSHRSKNANAGRTIIDIDSEGKVKKVVTGKVRTKKKTGIRRFAEAFIVEDMHNVKDYLIMDVLLPKIKETVLTIATTGLAMALCGEKEKNRNANTSKVSYGGFYSRQNRDDDRYRTQPKSVHDYSDIIFDSQADAMEVLRRLDETITAYGIATVADLYDAVGVTSDYTAENYGWTDLRGAKAIRGVDGWELRLPRAMPID